MWNAKEEAMSDETTDLHDQETKKNMRLLNNSIQSRKTSWDFQVFAVFLSKIWRVFGFRRVFVMCNAESFRAWFMKPIHFTIERMVKKTVVNLLTNYCISYKDIFYIS